MKDRRANLMSALRKIAKALDALHAIEVTSTDEPIQRAITCLNNADVHLTPLLTKKRDEEDPV